MRVGIDLELNTDAMNDLMKLANKYELDLHYVKDEKIIGFDITDLVDIDVKGGYKNGMV